ncbi:MAG: TolB family protein [Thermoleophilia bacterium]
MIFVVASQPVAAGPISTSILSTNSTGSEGNGPSIDPAISSDGRYVVFTSEASNLTAGDNDTVADIFRRDTQNGDILLISVSSLGVKGNGGSFAADISADGRYVVFSSYATNLSTTDGDIALDIFMRDIQTGFTTLISKNSQGEKGNPGGESRDPSISNDGRFVAFESTCSNLVPVDNNNVTDIFVRDTQELTTTRISVTGNGSQVVGHSYDAAISGDATKVAFWSLSGMGTGDPDALGDIFVKNLGTGHVELVSVNSSEEKGNAQSVGPEISQDGHLVSFDSTATNLVGVDNNNDRDVFVRDIDAGITTRASTTSSGAEADAWSEQASISDDGRFVAFESFAGNLSGSDGNGIADIFVKDRITGAVALLSLGNAGHLAGADSDDPVVSGDGRYVAFISLSDDLSPGDGNAESDVFIRHSGPRTAFTWYDNIYGANWIMFAYPNAAIGSAWFDVDVAGSPQAMPSLAGFSPGHVLEGRTLAARYAGLIGGPVDAGFHARETALVSQRILWAGNSLEEVVGTDAQNLSDHYYWTWYDEQSPGYKNWVLVANPTLSPIFYRIMVAGVTRSSGQIAGNSSITPRFQGVMEGPVELQTWSDAVDGVVPAYVMASQRVLMNGDTSFNEEPGIPYDSLSAHYDWTWYDMQSPGASNWILIANTGRDAANIWYEIRIMRDPEPDLTYWSDGPVATGTTESVTFPGVMGGPVMVRTFLDEQHLVEARSLASQRVLWGPSFEEVPGINGPVTQSNYHWTWYDQQSAGSSNWVLIANEVGQPQIYGVIMIGGVIVESHAGPISGGSTFAAQFPNEMGGPVEVSTYRESGGAPSPSFASQRVLWNGYFNEVTGIALP